jgi:hypothetical protein
MSLGDGVFCNHDHIVPKMEWEIENTAQLRVSVPPRETPCISLIEVESVNREVGSGYIRSAPSACPVRDKLKINN